MDHSKIFLNALNILKYLDHSLDPQELCQQLKQVNQLCSAKFHRKVSRFFKTKFDLVKIFPPGESESKNFPHFESEKISADISESKIFPSGESESKKLSTC